MAKKLPLESRIKDNEEILFDFFIDSGVKTCVVTFNGGGDDGQIGDITISPKNPNFMERNVRGVKVHTGYSWDEKNGNTSKYSKTEVTVEELIEHVCYQVLEKHFCGWEDNEGSFGEFRFNMKTRKIELDFNHNFVQSRLTRYSF